MRVAFTYTVDDMRELFAVSRRNKSAKATVAFRRNLIIWTIVITAGIWLYWLTARTGPSGSIKFFRRSNEGTLDMMSPGFIAIWVLVLIPIAWFYVRMRLPGKALKSQGLLDNLISCSFDSDGVTLSDASIESRLKWEAFDRWIETPERFFVRLNESPRFVMVPKRALENPADAEELRALFTAHVGAKTSAFPVLPAAP